MKKLSILPFLLCVMVSSGQKNSNNIEESFEMYGYVNGIRLDSIKASYAQVYYKSLALKKQHQLIHSIRIFQILLLLFASATLK